MRSALYLAVAVAMGWTAAYAEPNVTVVTSGPDAEGAAAAIVIVTDAQAEAAEVAKAVQVGKPAADEGVIAIARAWAAPRTMNLAYLGVSTSSAGETLRKQLGLPAGTGLVVDYVDEGGPAHAAGVRVHDVLTKLDAQILVNPPQLAVLVRLRKAGDAVPLTLIREGKEEKATATLIEKEQTVYADGAAMSWSGTWPGVVPPVPPKTIEDLILMREGQAAAKAMQANTVAAAFSMVMADGEHTLQVTMKDGKRHLTAKDAQGNVVFEGPIETEAERAAVPDAIRAKLDRMEPKVEIHMEGVPGQGGIRIQAVPHKAMPRMQAVPMPQRIERPVRPQPAKPAEDAPKDGEKPVQEDEKPADTAPKTVEKRVETKVEVQGGGAGGGAARSEVRMQDNEHDICITAGEKGGRLVAKDRKGNVLYDGPINTDEDMQKVPAAIREKIKGIQVNATVIQE